MLAKNDIFGQLEHTIVVGFYEALRSAMTAYGDWDGDVATFEGAAQNCITSSISEAQLGADLEATLRLCSDLANQRVADPKVTLKEVAKMKVYCDVYFVRKATDWMAQEKRRDSGQSPTPAESLL
jgi:hypothetical protein